MTKTSQRKKRHYQSGNLRLKEWDYTCSDELRQEAHQALKDEFTAVQKKSRSEKLSLERGIHHGNIGGKHYYRFEVDPLTTKQMNADKPHALEIHGNQVDGMLMSVSGKTVEVALSEYYGKVLPLLDIVFDLSLLLDLVDRRICEIDRDPSRFNVSIVDRLFTSLNWPTMDHLSLGLEHNNRKDGINLSSEQLNAIEKSLNNNFCLIWGPPGTGKTITLIGVIAELLAHGKRILFTSNTNSAIDNLLEQIIPNDSCPYECLQQSMKDNTIVRIGAQADPRVKDVFSPKAITRKLSVEIHEELKPLEEKLHDSQEQETSFSDLIRHLELAKQIIENWEALQSEYQAINQSGGCEALEIKAEKSRSLSKAYQSSIQALIPELVPMISKVADIYKDILIYRKKTHSNSLLLSSQQSRLKEVSSNIEAVNLEIGNLQSSWIKRRLNKTRLTEINTTIEKLRHEESSSLNAIQSTESNLKASTGQEAELMGRLHTILLPVIDMPEDMLEVINLVSNHCPKIQLDISEFPINEIFQTDKDLLKAFLNDAAINNLRIFFVLAWTQSKHGTDPIQSNLQLLQQESEELLASAQKIEGKISMLQPEYKNAVLLLEKYKTEESSIRQKIEDVQEEIIVLKSQIARLNHQLEQLNESIIKNSRLLCMTMVKASYDHRLIGMEFDALVADEFSMISLPQLYCVSSLVNQHVILCGDHLQLLPISQAKTPVGEKWLSRSFYDWHEGKYEERYKNNTAEVGRLKPFLATLSAQHRMPDAVSALVRPWYIKEGNELLDEWGRDEWEKLQSVSHELLEEHVVIFDTTDTNAYSSRSSSGSHYNLIHAGIAGELCRELIQEHDVSPENILIIAPYRDQAALTRAIIPQLLPQDVAKKLESAITTIHKSQGRGYPIVIYDLTDGIQQALTGFHKQQRPNLVNVALTRSKAHLILLCSYAKMKRALDGLMERSALDDVFQLLKRANTKIVNAKPYAERIFQYVSLSDLLTGDSIELTEGQKNSILVLNSATYYPTLKADLQKTRESVLIVSPFITRNRMDRLMPILEELHYTHGDSIRIELITRPPDKMFDRTATSSWSGASVKKILDRLVGLGVKVTLSPDTHGKLVVIDNLINYWGSLNTLSFRDTDEINTRLEARGLSKRLIRLARSGRSWPYKVSNLDFSDEKLLADYQIMARKDLNNLAWSICALYKRPRMFVLWRETIESLVSHPPSSWDEYYSIRELSRKGCVLKDHLEQIENIIYPIRGTRLPPIKSQNNIKQLSLFGDIDEQHQRSQQPRRGHIKDISKKRYSAADKASTSDLRSAVIGVLKKRPNNSCALHMLPKEVCVHLQILTRGKPRERLKKRLEKAVSLLVKQGKVVQYQAINHRIKLVKI